MAATPVAPSTPEALGNPKRSDLDTLDISNTSETRREEGSPSTPDHVEHRDMPATGYIFKWNEDDIDGSRSYRSYQKLPKAEAEDIQEVVTFVTSLANLTHVN